MLVLVLRFARNVSEMLIGKVKLVNGMLNKIHIIIIILYRFFSSLASRYIPAIAG